MRGGAAGRERGKIGNIWDLQRPEEGRAGAAGRPPEAGMRTAARIGGGAAGTAAPTGPLQGPEQERKGER